jgi:hypothetical protein
MLLRLLFILVVLVGLPRPFPSADGATNDVAKPSASPTQIRQWIAQLASDDYAAREAASAALVKHGAAVLKAIADVDVASDPEMLWRCVHIVQQVAISGDVEMLDRSIAILERLREAAPSGSSAILGSTSGDLRDRFRAHAQQQIIELGGVISQSHLGGGLGVDLNESFKGTAKHLRYLKVLGSITYIRLTGEKFDDDSLEHLKEISGLTQLHLMETAVTT